MPPILIIQRDAEARGLLTRILENEGLEVLEAGGVEDALSVLHVAHPALLLVDGGDDALDAADVVEALRAELDSGAPPAIALSSSDQEGDRARRAGAEVALRKPFAVEALLSAVRTFRGRRALDHSPG